MEDLFRNWDCKKPDTVMRLIEVWASLIPRWIADHVLEQLILPRITLHVHEWDPMTDTMPIHAWIHPWLPLLSESRARGGGWRSELQVTERRSFQALA